MSKTWNDLLPTSVEVGGKAYEIRSDYRAILDICVALSDPELSDRDRGFVVLDIFYPKYSEIPFAEYDEAIQKCFWFLNCGKENRNPTPRPKLVDWEQDFPYIVSPINRVTGKEIRSVEYMHWWTFVAAYYEIGDCIFAQIVRIRSALSRGKPLDKSDQEWYRKNRDLVDMQVQYTAAEDDILKQWCE